MKSWVDSGFCNVNSDRKSKLSLNNVMIAAPCSIRWEQMTPVEDSDSDIKRLCNQCNLHVYNVSNMTRSEAETFLSEQSHSVCLGLYRRKDGTLITKDCPFGVKLLNRARYRFASICASVLAVFGVTIIPVSAQDRGARFGIGVNTQYKPAWQDGFTADMLRVRNQRQYELTKREIFKNDSKIAELEFEQVPSDIRSRFASNMAQSGALLHYRIARNLVSKKNLKDAGLHFELALNEIRSNLNVHDPLFIKTVASDYIGILIQLNNKKRASEIGIEFLPVVKQDSGKKTLKFQKKSKQTNPAKSG